MSKKSLDIDKGLLQEALTIVKPGLAAKEVIEQSTSFAFVEGRVVTYNDAICISHPVPGVGISGAIKANELYSLLSKLNKGTLEMTEAEDGTIVLKAGRVKAGFVLNKEVTLPYVGITEEMKWKELPKNFAAGIKKVVTAASNDMSRPILTCIHFSDKGFIEASDSLRASRFGFKKKIKCDSFLLPTLASLQLLKIHPTHIGLSEGWIHFKNEAGTHFSSRSVEGEFPDLTTLLSLEKEKSFKFPAGLDDLILRAEPFYKRAAITQERVEVIITKGKVTIKASAEETSSWFSESMKASGIPDFSFSAAPSLLLDILDVEAEIEVSDRFLSFNVENWEYVCCIYKD